MFWCLLNVFSLKVEIFLVLYMSIRFRLYHRHFGYYVRRLWVSLKSCGVCWYFCFIRNQHNRFRPQFPASLLWVVKPVQHYSDPSCMWSTQGNTGTGLVVYPQSVLWVFGTAVQGQTQACAAWGLTHHFLNKLWGCFPSPSLSVASPDWSSSLGLHNPRARPHCAARF